MKRLNRKVLIILILITLILGVVFIFATTKVSDNLNKVFLVATIIDFIALTFLVQAFGFQSSKPKKIKYPQMDYNSEFEYSDLNEVLASNGFKKSKRSYGNSYLLIDGKTAIKVSLIDDFSNYFDNEQKESNAQNKELEKCDKFVGIEIFKEVDEASLDKLPLFTIQGKNVYFTALLYQENKLFKCLNYELPNEDFIEAYDKAMSILKMNKEVDE